MFNVFLSNKVKKEISKLDKVIRNRVFKELKKLQEQPIPKPKHLLASKGSSFLCELAIDKIRLYYYFTVGKLIIFDIKYEGKVEVFDLKKNHKSGSKNYPNQKKDINIFKKYFLNLFKKK